MKECECTPSFILIYIQLYLPALYQGYSQHFNSRMNSSRNVGSFAKRPV